MSAEASRFVRRAGAGTLEDGSMVTWSVAEGARGRRWRWTIAMGEGLRHAGLVELDPDGRFGRLELETARGMLTLHPDADRRSAHGNVVRPGGVEPVEVAWSDVDGLAIDDDPFGSAVAGWRGRGWVIELDLQLRREDGGDTRALELDERGIPRLDVAREWPLEI
jgi:hypothetical protein